MHTRSNEERYQILNNARRKKNNQRTYRNGVTIDIIPCTQVAGYKIT